MKKTELAETKACDVAFFEPLIPGNTGSTIRLSAVTGNKFYIIEPLGFEMTESKLKRAGLDYHDLANTIMCQNFEDFLSKIGQRRIFAFTTTAQKAYTDVKYREDDILLFGCEPTGLPEEIKKHLAITEEVRIPMREGLRSLNLAVSAALGVYETWRQHDFEGGR